MTEPDEHERCPLVAVDQRLDDLHRLWHQAEKAYFDPEAFRVAIQSAIQTMRSVTFILQKNKAAIPDFEAWYAPWQKKLGADALMVWMRDTRNTIEKEGDLEARSFVRAEIVASYLKNGPVIEVPAKLTDAPIQLVKSVPQGAFGDHVRTDGVVRIQRRWVENTLPDYELLDAVAIAYGRLSDLVADAHVQLGLPPPQTVDERSGRPYPTGARGGRLPCMIGHEEARTLDVWLATGQPVEFEEIIPKIELKAAPRLEGRYGIKPAEVFAKSDVAEDQLRALFATARKMFMKDGHHIMVAFLLRDGKPVRIMELRPGEHGHKYLMMRGLAHDVLKVGADAVILIAESWTAPADPERPMMRAVESPNRKEMLSAILVSKTGEPSMLTAEIKREGKMATLAPTVEQRGGAQFAFAPIYEAWGRPIPAEWTAGKTGPPSPTTPG
jgi:hypothetical protein